jgi:mannose-6-phosphate isomerase-like protein (cupin superfamily)
MATMHSKAFQKPDETRQFKAHGHLDVVNFEPNASIGRGVFEPGWKWSTDVKPLAGTESCLSEHTGYCISGRMTIKMDNGEQFTIKAGEAFYLAPGHDAWVEGDEPCILIDVTGFATYAKPH